MLRLLLRLWWLQQRRDFRWQEAIGGIYIVMLYVVVGIAFFMGYTDGGGELFEDGVPATLSAGVVLGTLLPDMVLKMLMKRDMTAMDDYLKSRPLPEKTWNKFLLLTNLVSFWNYVLPFLMLPVLIWLLSVPQALGCFLLLLAYSYVDGCYVTCYRKTADWMLRWPLILGWAGMCGALAGYMLLFAWLPSWLFSLGVLGLALVVAGVLVCYLYHLKNYGEVRHKASRFHSFSHTTLYGVQYVGLLRAKRVRNMVIMMVAIFYFDALLVAFSDMSEVGHDPLSVYAVGVILLPSTVLSQCTFGVEANYFQGLLTKPIAISQLLRNSYYFYLSISAVMTLLSVVFLFASDNVSVASLLAGFCMAIVVNLCYLPTCLYSPRLEIFSNTAFGGKKGKVQVNFLGFVFLIPTGLLAGVYYLWGEQVWQVACMVLAILALALHRRVICWVARIFYARRYQRMEKYAEA